MADIVRCGTLRNEEKLLEKAIRLYIYEPCIAVINCLFQQMHYTILVFSCPYICFGTYSAIFRGVESS